MYKPYLFETYSIIILSECGLKDMVLKCISRSNWFAVDPMSDNEWELVMKKENMEWLRRAASTIIHPSEWRQ